MTKHQRNRFQYCWCSLSLLCFSWNKKRYCGKLCEFFIQPAEKLKLWKKKKLKENRKENLFCGKSIKKQCELKER